MDVELSVLAPTSGCAQKLVNGMCQVHSSVAHVDLAVWSSFFRNSRKYGLESLRKEGTIPINPDPTSVQLALKPTTQPTDGDLYHAYKI